MTTKHPGAHQALTEKPAAAQCPDCKGDGEGIYVDTLCARCAGVGVVYPQGRAYLVRVAYQHVEEFVVNAVDAIEAAEKGLQYPFEDLNGGTFSVVQVRKA